MNVQAIDNRTNFQQKLILDGKTISRATREEKAELAEIKRMFKFNGLKGDIKVALNRVYSFKVSETEPKTNYTVSNNNEKITVRDIIEHLKTKYSNTESNKILSRKVEDAFGDGFIQ